MREGKPIEAASAALVWDGRILMVRRGREPARGWFAFPGGRLEPGESPEDAARREVTEETGLRPGRLRHLQTILTGSGEQRFRLHVFAGEIAGGSPVSGDDADHAAWYRLDELDGLPVTPSALELARNLLSGKS